MTLQRPGREGWCAPCGPGSRRRGQELEHAIFDAVLDELTTVGYDGLTIEGVATRAHTGKAAIYRRWSSKEDLVVDALHVKLPPVDDPPDTGSVRGDLLELLGRMASTISSRTGCAVQSVMGNLQCSTDVTRTVRDRVIEPRKQLMVDALRRGVARGEVRPDASLKLIAEVGPAMIVQKWLHDGPPVTKKTVQAIVDEVVMPMLRP